MKYKGHTVYQYIHKLIYMYMTMSLILLVLETFP